MAELEIEQISDEENSLIRSCKVEFNGNKIITPTKAISVTKSNDLELKATSSLIGNKYRTFGEVYTTVSLELLSQIKDDDSKGREFSSAISSRLLSLKEAGTAPYLVISIIDNNGNPYNQTLPEDVLNLIYNILWGTAGNSIIVPPLTGLLSSQDEYKKMISSLRSRIDASIDRKNLPIMAPIPSSYNLIDPKLLEEYWDIGCRMFAFNCDNKKYGALGYMVEKLHSELTNLKNRDEQEYILTALNSRLKIGKQDSSRINNLIGTGFGFDVYSSNHIPPKFFPGNTASTNYYLFESGSYGFEKLEDIAYGNCDCENILNSKAFKDIDFEDIENLSEYKLRKLTSSYNNESSVEEVMKYAKLIDGEELHEYLSDKSKISKEVTTMKEISEKTLSRDKLNSLEEWF